MVQQKNKTKVVSVIIPAYNEEKTIANVVRTANKNKNVDEVIVVDDGSEDDTFQEAKQVGAKVITLPENKGKATAMDHGVVNAKNNIICFLDADIENMNNKTLNKIIEPVTSEKYDMFIGICGRLKDKMNNLLLLLPKLGGQRVLTKEIWNYVPKTYKQDFQIELALNYYTKINNKRMGMKVFNDLNHIAKEKKYGLVTGFFERIKMYYDVMEISIKLYIYETLKQKIRSIL